MGGVNSSNLSIASYHYDGLQPVFKSNQLDLLYVHYILVDLSLQMRR